MTATYSAEDYARAQAHITTDPWATRMLAREFASLRTEHDKRVTELLDANNRYLERARAAERELDALNNQFGATARMLADTGRGRDKMRIALLGIAQMDVYTPEGEEMPHDVMRRVAKAGLEP